MELINKTMTDLLHQEIANKVVSEWEKYQLQLCSDVENQLQ